MVVPAVLQEEGCAARKEVSYLAQQSRNEREAYVQSFISRVGFHLAVTTNSRRWKVDQAAR